MSADRAEITDLLIRYATALDMREWQLLDSCFTEDAVADYGALAGSHTGVEAIREALTIVAGFDRTQHLLGNVAITVKGEEAHATCYLHAQHVIDRGSGMELLTIGGVYRDRILRTQRGWRIAHRQLETIWQSGDSDLVNVAAQRVGVAEAR